MHTVVQAKMDIGKIEQNLVKERSGQRHSRDRTPALDCEEDVVVNAH